jgi:hypothetical protein
MTPEQIALHEAGHAFIQWFTGTQLVLVTTTGPVFLDDPLKTPYYSTHRYVRSVYDMGHVDNFKATIFSGMGGAAIEMIKSGHLSYAALRDIYEAIKQLCADDPDIRRMADDARCLADSGDWQTASELFFQVHGHHATDIIGDPRAKKAIDALSERLLKDGSLSGYDAAATLQQAYGSPLPEKTLPLDKHDAGLRGCDQSLKSVYSSVSRLCKMGIDILREYRATDDAEADMVDRSVERLLELYFSFSEMADPAARP